MVVSFTQGGFPHWVVLAGRAGSGSSHYSVEPSWPRVEPARRPVTPQSTPDHRAGWRRSCDQRSCSCCEENNLKSDLKRSAWFDPVTMCCKMTNLAVSVLTILLAINFTEGEIQRSRRILGNYFVNSCCLISQVVDPQQSFAEKVSRFFCHVGSWQIEFGCR